MGNSEPDPTIGMERVNFTLKKAPILPPPPALVEPEQDVDETDDTISIAETEVSVATTVAIDTQLRKIIHKTDSKKDKKKKNRRKSRSPPPPATKFGSTTMPSIPAIVPKPTKEIFGKDLKDKVVREETPLRDDGNMSDASVYDPLRYVIFCFTGSKTHFSMFQKRDTLNPPTIERSPTPERKKRSSKRETKDKQKEKREKRKRSRSPKRRKRSRSRSPHRREKSPESSRTRSERRKE